MKTKLLTLSLVSILALAGCGGAKNAVETTDEQNAVEASETSTAYTIDTEASTLGWGASRIASSEHTGTMEVFSGEVFFDEDSNLEGGNFVIDMDSITEDKDMGKFIQHVKSADFFDVETYPTATFEITNVSPKLTEDFSHEIEGNLTIKDITKNITFMANVTEDNGVFMATADFEIDRTEWDIRYDSPKFYSDLGDKAIKDAIQFNLDLVANES